MEKKMTHELVGKVVSAKNNKTITVLVETYRKDPLYGKRVKYSKKYTAHDEKNEAKVGDKVRIVETRPLSKKKRFRLVEVIEKAITVKSIKEATLEGTTIYYLIDNEGQKYRVSLKVNSDILPFVNSGDTLNISYNLEKDVIDIIDLSK